MLARLQSGVSRLIWQPQNDLDWHRVKLAALNIILVVGVVIALGCEPPGEISLDKWQFYSIMTGVVILSVVNLMGCLIDSEISERLQGNRGRGNGFGRVPRQGPDDEGQAARNREAREAREEENRQEAHIYLKSEEGKRLVEGTTVTFVVGNCDEEQKESVAIPLIMQFNCDSLLSFFARMSSCVEGEDATPNLWGRHWKGLTLELSKVKLTELQDSLVDLLKLLRLKQPNQFLPLQTYLKILMNDRERLARFREQDQENSAFYDQLLGFLSILAADQAVFQTLD